jgi:large subunit ribosomal protein L9
MKVILNADIETLGTLGKVVEVKAGYARNYLLPKGLALPNTEHNINRMVFIRKKHEEKRAMEKLGAEEQKKKLEALTLQVTKKAGENDVLFGSVTTMEIAEMLEAKGLTVDRKRIHLSDQIKKLGDFTCTVRLFEGVDAVIPIKVLREGGEVEAKTAEPQQG